MTNRAAKYATPVGLTYDIGNYAATLPMNSCFGATKTPR